MRLIDTINHFIHELEGDLESISWEIREESNFEHNAIDYLSGEYDEKEKHLNNLKQIKLIIKINPIQQILNDPHDDLNEKIANALRESEEIWSNE